MLFAIWRWIQLWLPYGLILFMYKNNQALPCNIKTRNGRNLKAMMITTEHGIIFSEEVYVDNRLKRLKKKQQEVSKLNDNLMKEINSLDFIQREKLFGHLQEEENGTES